MASIGRIAERVRPFLLAAALAGVLPCPKANAACAPGDVKGSKYCRGPGAKNVLVFIHGVFGDENSTWLNKDKKTFWPQMAAGDKAFDDFDIYLVNFETPYFGAGMTIEDLVTSVYSRLADDKIFDHERVYFIAHSMGGLITKQMVVEMNEASATRRLLRKIRAVLFFATPAKGAPVADLAKWIILNPQVKEMGATGLSSFLQAMDHQWKMLFDDRRTESEGFPKAYCAYEIRPLKIGFLRTIKVVPEVYAQAVCDGIPVPMPFDHSEIVKPWDVAEDPYFWASARIREAQSAAAPTSTGSYSVSGTIFNQAKDKPIANARVILADDQGRLLSDFTTGDDGSYRFSEVPDPPKGYCKIEVHAPNRQAYSGIVEFIKDEGNDRAIRNNVILND